MFSVPSLPSPSRLARYWHLYLHRFGLPLAALGYMTHVTQVANKALQMNGLFCVLALLLLFVATCLWGQRSVVYVAIGVAATIWLSLLHGVAELLTGTSGAAFAILSHALYWAPVVAVYWGMAFWRQPLAAALLIILYYSTFLLIEPNVRMLTGADLLPFGRSLLLAQALVLLLLMAIFALLAAQLRISEARWRTAEHRANHDQLTGLLNRSTFSRHLPRIVKIAGLGKLDLSLLVIDFDHFKYINDHYGHSAGDIVLQKVARLLTSGLRHGDSLYRWGGEEFTIILRDTDAAMAAIIAERLRRKTERHAFGFKRTITMSVGLATLTPEETSEQFFRRADAAMLSAKRNGRNRVEIAPPGATAGADKQRAAAPNSQMPAPAADTLTNTLPLPRTP